MKLGGVGGSMIISAHPSPATLSFLLLPDKVSASCLRAFHPSRSFRNAISKTHQALSLSLSRPLKSYLLKNMPKAGFAS